ncbi:MAG: hypothetical protein WBC88_09850 [Candidatus Zixiibacteriota bacterium]
MKMVTIKEMFEKLSNKDAVKTSIANCSVALVGITVEGNRHRASFAASGTFVEIASKKGILTARHVVKKILAESQQFALSIQQSTHHFAIRREEVYVIEVPKPDEHTKGPDLAFVLLLRQDQVDTIQAHKYFLNLDKRREQVLSEPLPAEMGLWIVSGHPAADSTSEALPAEHIDLKGFPNKLDVCGVEREYTEKGFDYIEAGVDHASGGGVPEDLGGVSGGGLWQVPVSELKDGQTKADDPILLGVAFWQTGVSQGRSKVKCHGRRSIYGVLYDLVARQYSH